MKFVLIYWLLANAQSFSATGNVVFDDEFACRAALSSVQKSFPGDRAFDGPVGICVPQGTKAPDPVVAAVDPGRPSTSAPGSRPITPGK